MVDDIDIDGIANSIVYNNASSTSPYTALYIYMYMYMYMYTVVGMSEDAGQVTS